MHRFQDPDVWKPLIIINVTFILQVETIFSHHHQTNFLLTTDHHHADSNWIPCNERLHSALPRGSGFWLNIMIIASQWQRFWFGNHFANKIIPISLKYQASGSRLNPYDGALFSRIAVTLGQVSIYWWRQYNLSPFPKLYSLCIISSCYCGVQMTFWTFFMWLLCEEWYSKRNSMIQLSSVFLTGRMGPRRLLTLRFWWLTLVGKPLLMVPWSQHQVLSWL